MLTFVICFTIFGTIPHVSCTEGSLSPLYNAHTNISNELSEIFNISDSNNCQIQHLPRTSFEILSNDDLYLPMHNKTFPSSIYKVINGEMFICLPDSEKLDVTNGNNSVFKGNSNCIDYLYEPHEYERLKNGSVLLIDEILPEGTYEFLDDILVVCVHEEDYNELIDTNDTSTNAAPKSISDTSLIYVGNIGSGISIVALINYLIIFSVIRELRNLHGWNVTSMVIALLFGYVAFLTGQGGQVVGPACTASAVVQQYFFLSSFFWMNVISFDVWRALRNATKNLVVPLNKMKLVKFLLYSAYGWGMPLVSTIAAVIVDNSDNVPEHLRPQFGKYDICWFNSLDAIAFFFGIPSIMLFIINFIFFVLSCCMIINNAMKNPNSTQVATRKNFILYARLAVIMGITWLVGVIAVFTSSELWIVFNLLLSFQGVFIFVLFAFTQKVWRYFKRNISSSSRSSSAREPTTSIRQREISFSSQN